MYSSARAGGEIGEGLGTMRFRCAWVSGGGVLRRGHGGSWTWLGVGAGRGGGLGGGADAGEELSAGSKGRFCWRTSSALVGTSSPGKALARVDWVSRSGSGKSAPPGRGETEGSPSPLGGMSTSRTRELGTDKNVYPTKGKGRDRPVADAGWAWVNGGGLAGAALRLCPRRGAGLGGSRGMVLRRAPGDEVKAAVLIRGGAAEVPRPSRA